MNLFNINIQSLVNGGTAGFQFDLFNFFSLLIAIIALVISYYSWHKARATYDIKKYKFPKKVGESKSDKDRQDEASLKKELESGKWEILHIYDYNDDQLMIIIGKTKKN